MFKNKQFYHQHIKKAITAFGMIFTNINVNRVDKNNVTQQVIRVPLSYSTKQKFLSRIALVEDADDRAEVAITLPRMGFEIQNFEYDPARKISLVQKNKAIVAGANSGKVSSTFVSTPWNMTVDLYVFAKNQEDGLQIIEQILPFFNPDFNITVNELPEMGIKRDIKITLDNVAYDDQYEGEYASRMSIIWTLSFTMRLNFYGYVADQNIIREAVARAYTDITEAASTPYTQHTATITTKTATATSRIESGTVTTINVQYQGEGYLVAPDVTITGGGGSGATAEAILKDGKIISINVTSGGSGYNSAPTVTLESPPDTVEEPTPADPYRFVIDFEEIYE